MNFIDFLVTKKIFNSPQGQSLDTLIVDNANVSDDIIAAFDEYLLKYIEVDSLKQSSVENKIEAKTSPVENIGFKSNNELKDKIRDVVSKKDRLELIENIRNSLQAHSNIGSCFAYSKMFCKRLNILQSEVALVQNYTDKMQKLMLQLEAGQDKEFVLKSMLEITEAMDMFIDQVLSLDEINSETVSSFTKILL